ncbi:MAG: sel1 repeat family protein [Alphaproteobacteria bacterium]|nr:sel1 repeat family protein [Alphaproteobacteria bacterium]
MKKILFTLMLGILLYRPSYADEELELLSEEMLFSGTSEETDTEPTSDNSEKTGLFGFISNFFSGSDDSIDTAEKSPKETFLEKSERLALQGDIEAQMNLAYMYLYGINGADTDYAKSVKYYTMAAEQNNPIALNNLGSLYFNGIGVKKDIRQALELFQKSAELGNENASINLAFIYLSGGKKDAMRNQKAVDLLQKAQEKSHIAQFMLGYAYYKGFVVPQDYEKAFSLIEKSARNDSNIDEAQLVLALMYRRGLGTVQNYQKAVEAYRSSVSQGNMEAIMTLAKIYAKGQICPRNLVLAHALWNIAASRGVDNAAKMRDELVTEAKMNLEMLTKAQSIAQEYKAAPSELTNYIRQTYGTDIRSYIDNNMPLPQPVKK